MTEGPYKTRLIKKLRDRFPGCVILKNDAGYSQGIPDLVILYNDRWAMLEVKAHLNAPTQPNQPYWVERLNEMSFAAFISPEIEEDVLNDLQQALEPRRSTRFSKR